ncbi:MAG: hypothetical protein RLZZ450_1319 [Pseudomonadota bacterium]
MKKFWPQRWSAILVSAATFALIACSFVGTAHAQAFNPTINPSTTPIVVSSAPEKLVARPKVSDQKLVSVAFGATANGGNTKSYAGNLGGRFGLLRGNSQLMVEALGTLSGARRNKLTDVKQTAGNVVARARYDLFLSQLDAVFVAMAPRRDVFAGLQLRLQNQVGYLRNLYYPSDAHRIWSEIGYDLTYDNIGKVKGGTTGSAPTTAAPSSGSNTKRCDKENDTCLVHSARLFLGYTNRLSPTANLSLGVENLIDFINPGNLRVNGLVELTSSITQTFKLGLQSRFLYDRQPVENTEKYDVIAVAQLVYTFDSLAGTIQNACPVCDCTAQVNAARAACNSNDTLRTIR